jgi:Zn-dependent protease with chaperone function
MDLISPYMLVGRTDLECWLLALLVFSIGVLTIPNLNQLSNKAANRFWIGCLIMQPLLLVLFRWPSLVSNTWLTTGSLSITVLVGTLPGLAIFAQASRSRRISTMSWPIFLVALTVCLLFDLSQTLGLNDSSLLLEAGNSRSIPWGLILTLIASGWFSSLLIPRWFMWCSKSEPLIDDRAWELKIFWRNFHRRPPHIYLWPTSCRFSNAVLVGSMLNKKLLLTDKLLLTFHRRELEWITLHELAHITRHHQLIRLLPTALALPALYLVLTETDGVSLLLSSLALFLSFAGMITATCWWTEWDADARAIRYGSQFYKIDLAIAGAEYSSVLIKLYGANGTHRTSWTHPSLRKRIEAVSKLAPNTKISG